MSSNNGKLTQTIGTKDGVVAVTVPEMIWKTLWNCLQEEFGKVWRSGLGKS